MQIAVRKKSALYKITTVRGVTTRIARNDFSQSSALNKWKQGHECLTILIFTGDRFV